MMRHAGIISPILCNTLNISRFSFSIERTTFLLLLMLLTTVTAWAEENTNFPLTSGQTWTNATTNTKYTVSGEAGNLTLTASVADANVNDGKGTIADQAFNYCNLTGVKSIVINEGITTLSIKYQRSPALLI